MASQVAQQASAASIIESPVNHEENKQANTGTLEAEITSILSKQLPRAPVIPLLKIRLVQRGAPTTTHLPFCEAK